MWTYNFIAIAWFSFVLSEFHFYHSHHRYTCSILFSRAISEEKKKSRVKYSEKKLPCRRTKALRATKPISESVWHNFVHKYQLQIICLISLKAINRIFEIMMIFFESEPQLQSKVIDKNQRKNFLHLSVKMSRSYHTIIKNTAHFKRKSRWQISIHSLGLTKSSDLRSPRASFICIHSRSDLNWFSHFPSFSLTLKRK
jgi:hypothetical protein